MSLPTLQPLLDLFSSDLAAVRFGDVDGASLARLAVEAEAAEAEVAAAERTLEDARAVVAARTDALLQHAHRALAYARVFAEGDPALAAKLAAVALPKPRKARSAEETLAEPDLASAPPRRPRGRPRKVPLAPLAPLTTSVEASAE